MNVGRHAIVLTSVKTAATPLARLAPNPGDQFLWDLLASRADLVLVTGDKLLLQDKAMQPKVMLPRTFVTQLQQ